MRPHIEEVYKRDSAKEVFEANKNPVMSLKEFNKKIRDDNMIRDAERIIKKLEAVK